MSKPRTVKTVEVPVSLMRKIIRVLTRQQRLLEKLTGVKRREAKREGFTISPEAASAALQLYRGKAKR